MGVGWSEGEHGFTDGGYFGGGDADRGHVGFDLLVAGVVGFGEVMVMGMVLSSGCYDVDVVESFEVAVPVVSGEGGGEGSEAVASGIGDEEVGSGMSQSGDTVGQSGDVA